MSDLPKEIADMCGVVTEPEKPRMKDQLENDLNLKVEQDKDGIFRVSYRDENVGWIEPMPKNAYHPEKYRALSVHGRLGYFWTLDMATTFLMENYY